VPLSNFAAIYPLTSLHALFHAARNDLERNASLSAKFTHALKTVKSTAA